MKRCVWTDAEDELLRQLVSKHGPKKWSLMAYLLQNKTGKQCRERWHNQLNPDVCKAPWTKEEDEAILRLVEELGTKWACIARRMKGRTDNAIKNRYNSSLKRYQGKVRDGLSSMPSQDSDAEDDNSDKPDLSPEDEAVDPAPRQSTKRKAQMEPPATSPALKKRSPSVRSLAPQPQQPPHTSDDSDADANLRRLVAQKVFLGSFPDPSSVVDALRTESQAARTPTFATPSPVVSSFPPASSLAATHHHQQQVSTNSPPSVSPAVSPVPPRANTLQRQLSQTSILGVIDTPPNTSHYLPLGPGRTSITDVISMSPVEPYETPKGLLGHLTSFNALNNNSNSSRFVQPSPPTASRSPSSMNITAFLNPSSAPPVVIPSRSPALPSYHKTTPHMPSPAQHVTLYQNTSNLPPIAPQPSSYPLPSPQWSPCSPHPTPSPSMCSNPSSSPLSLADISAIHSGVSQFCPNNNSIGCHVVDPARFKHLYRLSSKGGL